MPFVLSSQKSVGDVPQCGCIFKDFIILGYDNGIMKIVTYSYFETGNNEFMKVIEGHKDAINGFTIVNDQEIISYSADTLANVWEFADDNTVKCIKCLEGHTDSITDCVVASFGILTSSEDSTIIVWDSNYTQTSVYDCHKEINSINILYNTYLIISSPDSTIQVWNITNDMSEEKSLLKDTPKYIVCQNTIQDTYSIMGDKNGYLYIYDVENGWKLIYNDKIHNDTVTNIIVLSETTIITSGLDDLINILNFTSESVILIEKIEGHCGGITTLLSNSSRQIISYHTNGELRIYNYTESIDNDDEDEIELASHKKRKIETWQNEETSDCDVPVFNIIYQYNYIITTHKDKIIKLWDKNMICKLLKTIECECIVSKIYPFLNNYLLCGDDNGTIIIRDLSQENVPIVRLCVNTKRISDLKCDERYIYSGADDGTFSVFDSQDSYKNIIINKDYHTQPIVSIVNFEDKILTISNDGVITCYNKSFKCNYSVNTALNFTCSEIVNGLLAVGTKNGFIVIYQPSTISIDLIQKLHIFDSYIFAMCYHEQMLFVCGYSCSISIVDPSHDFNLIMNLGGHFGPVLSLCCYNNQVISGSYDRTTKTWKKIITS